MIEMMRVVLGILCAVGLVVGLAAPAAGRGDYALAIVDVAHALDGNALVVSGVIANLGQPVTGLVIDASGFSVQGPVVVSGSDGIPWTLPVGGRERFSVRLPLGDALIREYSVQVALARPPFAPLASAGRSVDLALYRPLILAQVQLRGDLAGGWLIVRSRAGGLPALEVIAEITVLFTARRATWLQTFTVTVPADGSVTIPIGFNASAVVAVRVADVLLKINW